MLRTPFTEIFGVVFSDRGAGAGVFMTCSGSGMGALYAIICGIWKKNILYLKPAAS